MGFPLADFAKGFQANGRILAQDLSKDLMGSKYSKVTSQEVPHTCKCFSAPFSFHSGGKKDNLCDLSLA